MAGIAIVRRPPDNDYDRILGKLHRDMTPDAVIQLAKDEKVYCNAHDYSKTHKVLLGRTTWRGFVLREGVASLMFDDGQHLNAGYVTYYLRGEEDNEVRNLRF